MKNHRSIVFALFSLMAMIVAVAQNPDRKEWFKEMRQYKHEFLVKSLGLSQEQQGKFFPLYDDMEQRLHRLQKETNDIERRVCKSGEKNSDLEYEKAAEAMFELKGREAAIEEQYYDKFKSVLTMKQLFELKRAERKFTRELMKHHQRMREGKK